MLKLLRANANANLEKLSKLVNFCVDVQIRVSRVLKNTKIFGEILKSLIIDFHDTLMIC